MTSGEGFVGLVFDAQNVYDYRVETVPDPFCLPIPSAPSERFKVPSVASLADIYRQGDSMYH